MKKDPIAILRKSGLKKTPTRLAILSVFSEGCKPVNAEYIFKKLKTRKTSIVTIYRTLMSFEVACILSRVELHKESAHYELAGHHHHHIICTDCGTVESFDKCDVGHISEKALSKSLKFRVITQHSLEFFGVCNSCVKG
jgi:Fe2+ or Zn2+ uptake regulation protein